MQKDRKRKRESWVNCWGDKGVKKVRVECGKQAGRDRNEEVNKNRVREKADDERMRN